MTEAQETGKLTTFLAIVAAVTLLLALMIEIAPVAVVLANAPQTAMAPFFYTMLGKGGFIILSAFFGIILTGIAVVWAARGNTHNAILIVSAVALFSAVANIIFYAHSIATLGIPDFLGLANAAALLLAWKTRWLTFSAGLLATLGTYRAASSAYATYYMIHVLGVPLLG